LGGRRTAHGRRLPPAAEGSLQLGREAALVVMTLMLVLMMPVLLRQRRRRFLSVERDAEEVAVHVRRLVVVLRPLREPALDRWVPVQHPAALAERVVPPLGIGKVIVVVSV